MRITSKDDRHCWPGSCTARVVGDDATVDVIAHRIQGSEDANVREAAFARCRASMNVLDAAADAVSEAFDAAPSHQTWQLTGVEFIAGGVPRPFDDASFLRPLVRGLVEAGAPSCCPAPELPEPLRRLRARAARSTLSRGASTRS